MKPRYFLSKILSKCSNHHLIKAIMNNLTTQRNPEILFLIKIVYDHTYNFLEKNTHLIGYVLKRHNSRSPQFEFFLKF